MQEIITKNQYDEMLQTYKQVCEKAIAEFDSPLSLEALESEFFYLLGVMTAASIAEPSIEKPKLLDLVELEDEDAGFEDVESETEAFDKFKEIYEKVFPDFLEKSWALVQEFIGKLNKLLSSDEDFELPSEGLADFCTDFDYEVFAEGFISAFGFLDERINSFEDEESDEESDDEEANEELFEALYPMILLANLEDDEELSEEAFVKIAEDLEYIISAIYTASLA